MRTLKRSVITLIALVAIAFAWSQATAQNATKPVAPTAKVATCDIANVLNNYEKAKVLQSDFRARAAKIKAEDDQRQEAVKNIQSMLNSLTPGTKDYDAREQEMEKLIVDRQVWASIQEKLAKRDGRRQAEEMYKEVLAAVEKVAKEKGFDLVITRDNMEVASASMEELLDKMAQRKCLYADPSLDITDAVSELINRPYKK